MSIRRTAPASAAPVRRTASPVQGNLAMKQNDDDWSTF
jgi:methyl-accepting chemotaxis protein